MHQITAESFRNRSPNSADYGSDMEGGSSGGPFVQNFGYAASGQVSKRNPARNRVIGVVSYGPTDTTRGYQGASKFDSRFTSIFKTMCARRSGNCSN